MYSYLKNQWDFNQQDKVMQLQKHKEKMAKQKKQLKFMKKPMGLSMKT